jgi:hypothetical protein
LLRGYTLNKSDSARGAWARMNEASFTESVYLHREVFVAVLFTCSAIADSRLQSSSHVIEQISRSESRCFSARFKSPYIR